MGWKGKNVYMLVFGIFLICSSLKGSFGWWNENWTRRIPVIINNPLNETITEYQLKMIIQYDSDMKNDFSDLRFIKKDHLTKIPCWFEEVFPSESAIVWIKFDTLAGMSNDTIYIYFGNPIANFDTLPKDSIFEILEVDTLTIPLQSYPHQWFKFGFKKKHKKPPLVIAQPELTYNGSEELTIRIDSITADSFKIRQQEPSNRDDKHAKEKVCYFALPEGSWVSLNGKVRIEAGKILTNKWIRGDGDNDDSDTTLWQKVAFRYPFEDSNIVVITQIQTYNYPLQDTEAHTRQLFIHNDTFAFAIEPEGKVQSYLNYNEVVGWIAVKIGIDTFEEGILYEANTFQADEHWETVYFLGNYSSPPMAICWVLSYEGGDAIRVRGHHWASNSIEYRVQEDKSYDSETDHVYEDLGYILLSSPGIYYIRKYIPDSLLVYFGNKEYLPMLNSVEILDTINWSPDTTYENPVAIIISGEYIDSVYVSENPSFSSYVAYQVEDNDTILFNLTYGVGIKQIWVFGLNSAWITDTLTDSIYAIGAYLGSINMYDISGNFAGSDTITDSNAVYVVMENYQYLPDSLIIDTLPDFSTAEWQEFKDTVIFTFDYPEGTWVKIYVKIKNDFGESEILEDSIYYYVPTSTNEKRTEFPKKFIFTLKDGNIFKNSLDIKIGIPEEDILRFEIYSIDGRKIYSFEKFMKKGWHKLKINIKHNGIYILKYRYKNKVGIKKILKF